MKMKTQRVKSYYRYLIHNWGIMNCSFCQMSRCRDGTFNIHQDIYLDGSSIMM